MSLLSVNHGKKINNNNRPIPIHDTEKTVIGRPIYRSITILTLIHPFHHWTPSDVGFVMGRQGGKLDGGEGCCRLAGLLHAHLFAQGHQMSASGIWESDRFSFRWWWQCRLRFNLIPKYTQFSCHTDRVLPCIQWHCNGGLIIPFFFFDCHCLVVGCSSGSPNAEAFSYLKWVRGVHPVSCLPKHHANTMKI